MSNIFTVQLGLQFGMIREMVKEILKSPGSHDGWTLQGFGMLRLNFENDLRLAVWHSAFRVKGVSMIHDHPWDFESLIVTGRMRNQRYVRTARDGEEFFEQVIVAGAGGGLEGKPAPVLLRKKLIEEYTPGNVYTQRKDEIHESVPDDGTITLCQRSSRNDDPDRAKVFYLRSEKWGSAEPRAAKKAEVQQITARALAQINGKENVSWRKR